MSGSVPPNIAEFPDHYFRNDDIIRPKPRRLVDMRRSAIGVDYNLPQLSPGGGGDSSHSSMTFSPMSSSPGGGSSSLQISPSSSVGGNGPPSLPAKPPPHLSTSPCKPLPPRPSSTNSSMFSPPLSSSPMLLKPIPFDSGQYVAPNPGPQNFNKHSNSSPSSRMINNFSPPIHNNGNLRSIPNLPQLPQLTGLGMLGGQQSHQPYNGAASATDHTLLAKQQQHAANQRRLFLSPQPHHTNPLTSSSYLNAFNGGNIGKPVVGQGQHPFGGSNGNLIDGHNGGRRDSVMSLNANMDNGKDTPYYAELTAPSSSHPKSSTPSSNPGFLPAPYPLAEHLRSKSIQHTQHLMELKSRVQRVEWKSADSLQAQAQHQQQQQSQNYYSPLVSTNTIEFGESNKPSWNGSGVPDQGGGVGLSVASSKSTGKLANFEGGSANKSSLPLSLPPNCTNHGGASLLRKTVELPMKSPEYDQIKSPSEIAKERLEAMLAARIVSMNNNNASSTPGEMGNVNGSGDKSVGGGIVSDFANNGDYKSDPVKVDMSDSTTPTHENEKDSTSNGGVPDSLMKNNKGEGNSASDKLLPTSVLSNNNLNNSNNNKNAGGGGGTESTDCSSLGRSSNSDGDFRTLGGNRGGDGVDGNSCSGTFNMYTSNAGSTPSARKGRHSGSSSKVKSRRRNILQHLSVEEMRLLNGGTGGVGGRCAGNTGTGGSSSDGSSGHASMSDSQTSGSPPAEYARIMGISGSGGGVSASGSVSNGYKSVLKSVPEDDSTVTSSTQKLLSSGGNNSTGGGRLDSHNRSFGSSGSSGKKSSSRSRHRNNKQPDSLLLSNGNHGLEDIKHAIEQLTLRSSSGGSSSTMLMGHHGLGSSGSATVTGHHATSHHAVRGGTGDTGHHSSYSTSTYSSMSGSECDRQHRRPHHLIRHSSLETINTQVTSADEFVWVDSHNRLVELQQYPWSNHDILKVIEKSSRLKDNLERISMETIPRISYLLQRALVRVARETQRLAKTSGFCSKVEVASALKIVFAPSIADSCSKACLRAAAMFAVTTKDALHRESKSGRAGLHLHVGRFQRWMVEVRLGRFVHEFAAIYLTAIIENLIEVILCRALSYVANNYAESAGGAGGQGGTAIAMNNNGHPVLMAASLEQSIASNGDLWGLLQPYAHLNAGKTASGALALPRWSSVASMDSSGSSSNSSTTIAGAGSGSNSSNNSSTTSNHEEQLISSLSTSTSTSTARMRSPPPLQPPPPPTQTQQNNHHQHNKSLEQSLLTTCSQMINTESIVSLYIHAKVYNAVQLLEYCQGFLLQNMVALLTYDDSVRRLIFGKKLHNHDVLAGLLLTLQARLKSKPSRKSK